jgi:hypothetical protein
VTIAARLCQRLFDIAEGLPELGVEIGRKRLTRVVDLTGMSGDENHPPCGFGDDCRRERPLLLPRTANERFFHACKSPRADR